MRVRVAGSTVRSCGGTPASVIVATIAIQPSLLEAVPVNDIGLPDVSGVST